MNLKLNASTRSRKLRFAGVVGAVAISLGTGVVLSGAAAAMTISPSPQPCLPCHAPSEGPTVLEVGSVSIYGGAPDWVVTGYGYTPGNTWKVQIDNAATSQVYDTTTASSQSNGTIAAYSPLNPPAPNGQLSFTAGRPVRPLPFCGVTLRAVLTDFTVATSEDVALPACPPPPPPPQ
jgi:hypothetical protein